MVFFIEGNHAFMSERKSIMAIAMPVWETVTIAPANRGRKPSPWHEHMTKGKAGQSFLTHKKHMGSIQNAAKKAGIKFGMRSIDKAQGTIRIFIKCP